MRRFVPSRPTPASQTPIVDKTVKAQTAVHTARTSFIWGIINIVVSLIIFYDFFYACPWYTSTFQYIEGAFAILLALNALFHFYRYVKNSYWMEPLLLTPKQKKLLGVKNSNPHIKFPSTPTSSTPVMHNTPATPINFSCVSWHNTSMSTPNNESLSPNYSMSSPSWVYRQGSPDMTLPMTPNDSIRSRQHVGSPNASILSNASSAGIIEDEQSLSQYLKEYETHEKKAVVEKSVEPPTSLLGSFWSHPTTRATNETSPMLRRCTYQMAPPTPPTTSSIPGGGPVDDSGSPSSFLQNQELWRRVGVNPNALTQWAANLRMWISQTVLKRLVDEITLVDEALLRQGLADMRIGAVGLERLKKTAQIAQVLHNIPTLPSLIQFLEVTPHQEYLVARIKDLAKGGCMSEYRWNSGGSLNGKDWEENLPTDSVIVMHMLATYLDSQLPPLTKNPEGRPFSSQYLVKSPEKPGKDSNIVIYQTQINPPYYVVVFKDETLKVPRGQSNLFHAILLFLHLVKKSESGMLGRVNLGPSGINMLWVIEG